jgi:hypothetical protein
LTVTGLRQYNAVKLAPEQHETLEEIARRRGLAQVLVEQVVVVLHATKAT